MARARPDLQDPVQHDRIKNVEVDRFFIREKLEENIIAVSHIHFDDQLADILTKVISNKIFFSLIGKLGMLNIYAQT
ncbi:hypothetical protein LguiA_003466 [Lonicera macranthoides]